MEIKDNNDNTNMESEENFNDNFTRDSSSDSGIDNVRISIPVESDGQMDIFNIGNDNAVNGLDSIQSSSDTGSTPDTENADVSDGNAAHMEGNAAIETDVSGNNLYPPTVSVSGGDIYVEYYGSPSCSCGDAFTSPFMEEDITHINGTLDALLFTADGILFFILFAWAEKKISNGIRKLFHNIKPNQ